MPLTLEWNEIPFTIQSDEGDLDLNVEQGTTGWKFLLDPAGCHARRPLRVVSDPVPQADGEIHHTRFAQGYQVELAVQLWLADEPGCACGDDLVGMHDLLMRHLEAIRNGDNGRLIWTPSGYGDCRMLDHLRLLDIGDDSFDDGCWTMHFQVDSPFPYAIDCTEQDIELSPSATFTNEGNTDYYPVFRIDGPFSTFSLANNTTGLFVIYDDSLPGAVSVGGGDYAEIDCFRNTIYLNGNQTNLKPGITLDTSDFFTIPPGSNNINLGGAPSGTLLFNNPWL